MFFRVRFRLLLLFLSFIIIVRFLFLSTTIATTKTIFIRFFVVGIYTLPKVVERIYIVFYFVRHITCLLLLYELLCTVNRIVVLASRESTLWIVWNSKRLRLLWVTLCIICLISKIRTYYHNYTPSKPTVTHWADITYWNSFCWKYYYWFSNVVNNYGY